MNKPYVIFILSNKNSKTEYLDGAFLTTSGETGIQLSEYFLNHDVVNVARSKLSEYHKTVDALTIMLIKFGVGTLTALSHYLQCRHDIRNIHGLPAFASKCSSERCWYCQDLCHYCLKPAISSCSLPNSTIRYCSNLCLSLLCTHPNELSNNIIVFNHCIDGDNYSGISMLDILKIHRSDHSNVNQFELVHVCMECCPGSPSNYNPYIIWQMHTIHTQVISIFYISEEGKILSPFPSDDQQFATTVTQNMHKHQSFLKNLIDLATQSLGYTKFSAFLSHCFNFLNKSKSSQSDHCVENTSSNQSEEKVMLFVSTLSQPKPKIVIPEHFVKGISIASNQFVEITVDLSHSDDLRVDVSVTSPFQDEFNLQLRAVNKNIARGQFIPAVAGEYILHLILKLSIATKSLTQLVLQIDTLNVTVTVF